MIRVAHLIFGRESRGLDEDIIARYESSCVRIPMRDGLRSLNLSNAVAIGAFEAFVSWGSPVCSSMFSAYGRRMSRTAC